MNEAAIKLVREAVLRALFKSPSDVDFYQAQVDDPYVTEEYRRALREAIAEAKKNPSKRTTEM